MNNLPQVRRASDISASYENPTFNESIAHDVDHLADDLMNNRFLMEDDEDSAIIPSDIIEFNEFNDIFEDYLNEKSSNHIENIAVTDVSLAAQMSPENPEQ